MNLPAPVTLDGVANVFPGLAASQVRARWRVPVRVQPVAGLDCGTAIIRAPGVRGYALFLDGAFDSVTFERGAGTRKGIRIGSTVAALRRAYGPRLSVRPDAYVRGARNFFLTRANRPAWQMRFDVNPAGRVTAIGMGGESVRYSEGCA